MFYSRLVYMYLISIPRLLLHKRNIFVSSTFQDAPDNTTCMIEDSYYYTFTFLILILLIKIHVVLLLILVEN